MDIMRHPYALAFSIYHGSAISYLNFTISNSFAITIAKERENKGFKIIPKSIYHLKVSTFVVSSVTLDLYLDCTIYSAMEFAI